MKSSQLAAFLPKKFSKVTKSGPDALYEEESMSDGSSFRVDRRPYTVTYYKNGEKHTIRRRPPKKQHNLLPTDIVELKSKRSDDFLAGESYELKHINNRHPNTLQLTDGDGKTTFVSHRDVELKEAFIERPGVITVDAAETQRYLLWP